MFPDLIPLGNGNAIQSYDVMVVLGIIAAILLYRLLSKRVGLSDKAYNFYLYTSLAAVVFGFVFAAIFDALYKGKFVQLLRYVFSFGKQDSESGLTFYGGLIGGVLTFVVAYFIAKPPVRKEFYKLLLFAPACVLAAHMFGRLGCFLAGCCYGRPGTGFLYFDFYPFDGVTNLGVQLIEALFIGALIYPALRWKKFSAFIYLFGYGLFRFVIEFFRADDRGGNTADNLAYAGGLSPSQIISLILLGVGGVLLALYLLHLKGKIKIPFFPPVENAEAVAVTPQDAE